MITSIKVIMDTHVSLLGPREPKEVRHGRPTHWRTFKTENQDGVSLEVKLLTFDASSLLVRTEENGARPRDNRVVSHRTEDGQSVEKDEKNQHNLQAQTSVVGGV